MLPAVMFNMVMLAMSAHVDHPPTVVCNMSMQAGRDVGGVGGERRDVTGTGTGV